MHSDEEGLIPSPFAKRNYIIPDITLHDYMFNRIEKILKEHGDRIWAKEMLSGKQIMFSEVRGHVRRVASGLLRLGFPSGTRVLFYSNNYIEYPTTMIAIWCLGGIITLLDPKLTVDRVASKLKKLKAKFLFCDLETARNSVHAVNSAELDVNLFYFDDGRDSNNNKTAPDDVRSFTDVLWNDDGSAYKEYICKDFDEPIAYLSSSGTTGEPKSIAHSHRTLIAALEQIQSPRPLLSSMFASSQLYHLSGWYVLVWTSTVGVSYHFASFYEEESWLKALQDSKAYRVFAFTFHVNMLATSPLVDKYDLSHMRYLCTGAGSISPETMMNVRRRLPNLKVAVQIYGTTEFLIATSGLSEMPELNEGDCEFDEPIASVLYPAPYMKLKILDLNTRKPVGPNRRGEIVAKAPTACHGYLDDPEATAALFTDDGWMRSGDEGYYDEKGRIYITGRLKNVIKYRLDHVSPGAIEDVIHRHQEVVEAAVVGVPAGDIGELPRAYVALKPGSKLTAEQLNLFVKDHLMDSEQLRGGIEFMSILPRNKIGKVIYTDLQVLASKIPTTNGHLLNEE